ncbi:hypothetical protein HYDPIDRAFT_26842 [Hydnomerulius pinastri MD-312]|nr:hypothetical protein HYDPIDRAFT_26842 [Hydnomerulius pinastri MD-312]
MSTTSFNKTPQPSSHNALSGTRLTEGVVAKEVRAHEHARHRTKERREHAHAKERKEKAAAVRALGLKVSQGARLNRRLSMESWDGEEPDELPSKPSVPTIDSEAPPRPSTGSFTELTLKDLISLPRRKKAKKLDFEVIPPVRAVIALDDFGRDIEAGEPWEYISRSSLNDEPTWKGMSYAQAAANTL